jgi:hypothetical protein
MMSGKPLSATMAAALGETIERGGKLVRYVGGYWSTAGIERNAGVPIWYVGASTVQALERRGRLRYTDWQEGRRGRFPIGAEVVS